MNPQHSSTEPTSLREQALRTITILELELQLAELRGDEDIANTAKLQAVDDLLAAFMEEITKLREQAEEYELNMHGFYDKDVSDHVTAIPLSALDKWVEGLTK